LDAVVEKLRERFGNEVDIIIPDRSTKVGNSAATTQVSLDLRNVGASEVFGALNHLFLATGAPLRWNLTMNGSRPTAVLLPADGDGAGGAKPQITQSILYVGDSTSPKWPTEKIAATIEQIVRDTTTDQTEFTVRVHPPADIIVVSGSGSQVALAREASMALARQARRDNDILAQKEAKAVAEKTKHDSPAQTTAPAN
jgi:hypothetical protein